MLQDRRESRTRYVCPCMAQVARAFNRVYGLRLTVRGEMEVAYQGERLTPSMCGRMDQVHSTLGPHFACSCLHLRGVS